MQKQKLILRDAAAGANKRRESLAISLVMILAGEKMTIFSSELFVPRFTPGISLLTVFNLRKKWGLAKGLIVGSLVCVSHQARARDISYHLSAIGARTMHAIASPVLLSRCAEILSACGQPVVDSAKCNYFAIDRYRQHSEYTVDLNTLQKTYFKSEAEELASDPRSLGFLEDLAKKVATNEKFNLWDFTYNNRNVRQHPQRKAWALKLLAIFFQRTEVGTSLPPIVSGRVAFLNTALDSRIKDGTISAYPRGFDSPNRGIYHFYANAHLANKLLEDGYALRFALAAPWVVNDAYERLQLGQNVRHASRDILAGFAGPTFAVSADTTTYMGPKVSPDINLSLGKTAAQFISYISKDKFCKDGAMQPIENTPKNIDVEGLLSSVKKNPSRTGAR